jgi:hypothetical protein
MPTELSDSAMSEQMELNATSPAACATAAAAADAGRACQLANAAECCRSRATHASYPPAHSPCAPPPLSANVKSVKRILSARCQRPRGRYGDEKVANRDIRVWHGATEKGP